MDKIIQMLAYKGRIQMICIDTTELVEEARKVHKLSPVATAALGRTLTMASMMATSLKGKDNKLTVQVKGNGPIGEIVVTANSSLQIKGYVSNPTVDVPYREDGKLNVGEAVGTDGYLYVIKDVGMKEPYMGISKLITGEIAEDFTNYYYISEQKNTAIALGVLVDKNGVKSSGGYMITAMPDATADDIFILEERIKEAKPISKMLEENKTLIEIAQDITGDSNLQILEEDKKPIYQCNCSKEKMQNALKMLGKEELTQIKEEDKKAELSCHFCNKSFTFSKEELEEIIESC